MSEVIRGRVPLTRDGNFQCKTYASSFMGGGVWNKPHQLNMNLKLKFTTRCALKISNMEEDTGYLGKAAVLAIGTAVPPNYINQSDYPDYYFRVTNSEHLGELKEKFKRICGATKIRKRHFCLTEEMIQDHPIIAGTNQEKSLNVRNSLLAVTPELGKEAANKALQEWGQSRSKITHVIFHSSGCSIDMPGPDYKMINLLGLSPAVNRTMLYYNGCYAGGAALRLAKDIVENNRSARVLAICSECTIGTFRGPSESSVGDLVSQALFSDAASAVIIGSNPDLSVEKPLFNIVSAKQTMCPGTDDAIHCHLTEAGVETFLARDVTEHIANRVGKCTSDALAPLGITDHNSLFWIVHPGGPKILDGIENALELEKDKLRVSRHILTEYGNESSASVFHVMDEMRRRSKKDGKATTGEGEEFGMLIGLGPGLTVETVVVRATAITK